MLEGASYNGEIRVIIKASTFRFRYLYLMKRKKVGRDD